MSGKKLILTFKASNKVHASEITAEVHTTKSLFRSQPNLFSEVLLRNIII